MIDEQKENECDCLRFKKLFESSESGQTLLHSEQNSIDRHAENCRSCSSFAGQHAEIAELSRRLPQFDVSEGLTQKILDSVGKQSTPGLETSLLPIGLATSVAFLVLVPFDSLQSLYGWGAGILGLLALQILIKTANAREQVI